MNMRTRAKKKKNQIIIHQNFYWDLLVENVNYFINKIQKIFYILSCTVLIYLPAIIY